MKKLAALLLVICSGIALGFPVTNETEYNAELNSESSENVKRWPDEFWEYHFSGEEHHSYLTKRDLSIGKWKLRGKNVDQAGLGIRNGPKQLSGYVDNNSEDKHVFYWFIESASNPKTDPVIIWLSGGPGGSSSGPAVSGIGPYIIATDGKPVPYSHSWNKKASILFIDAPVNAGYSYSKRQVKTTLMASQDLYAVATLFFKQFPQYSKLPTHVYGISYGGHFAPALANEILLHNDTNINLQGLMIANGLTDPMTQYASWPRMACGQGGQPAIFNAKYCEHLKTNALPKCKSLMSLCYKDLKRTTCAVAVQYCVGELSESVKKIGIDIYDLRSRKGTKLRRRSDFEKSPVVGYLKSARVKRAIGAEGNFHGWNNPAITLAFYRSGDVGMPIQRVMPHVLSKIPVLVYAGDSDYICNWLGIKDWTEAVPWSGKAKYNKVRLTPWVVNGKTVGQKKSANGLTFIRMYNSGHGTNVDQPALTLELTNSFLRAPRSFSAAAGNIRKPNKNRTQRGRKTAKAHSQEKGIFKGHSQETETVLDVDSPESVPEQEATGAPEPEATSVPEPETKAVPEPVPEGSNTTDSSVGIDKHLDEEVHELLRNATAKLDPEKMVFDPML
ncbi:hypothetical protein H072_7670 [Dactylellina haptotyla CBS 200.50]|uniref:carboxypeptidase C n=1 Tax=Dactylellina haptotyla (strain CBS 200.50) TaxID=1284197 RepID=S8A6D3_DACHA|nr:hypothetical protein H072_7670 [Dactylellina haptotyla CBS 200.50]